ncbi:right-handed parallel beta-helix repeat-containing protein [Luteipulveratus halotolerans]|nr:DUF1565 domain-containing protein [Luteipulveratus halotolerans]
MLDGSIIPGSAAASPVADAGSVTVGAATYAAPSGAVYLATTGSDSNAGTAAAPVATLTRAVALAGDDGTVVVRAGTYFEGADTQSQTYPAGIYVDRSDLTIQAYPGEAVWFDGSQVATGWVAADGFWSTAYDRVFDRSPTMSSGANDSTDAGWNWVDPAYPQACWPDAVWVAGVAYEQVTDKDKLAPGKFWVDGATTTAKWFAGTRLWLGDDPTGKTVRYAAKAKLATVKGDRVTLRGVGVRRYASAMATHGALYADGQRLTLENVVVQDVGAFGINIDSSADTTLTKVTVQRTGSIGVNTNKSDRLTFDRCLFDATCSGGFNYNAPGSGGVKVCKAQGGIIKRSVFRNGLHGAWTDQSVYAFHVVSSLFENNTRDAVQQELSGSGIIANNRFVGTGRSHINVHNTDRARVYNNTCRTLGGATLPPSGQRRAILFRQDNRRPGNTGYAKDTRQPDTGFWDQPQNVWQINDLACCNNIVAGNGQNVQSVLAIDDLERNTGGGRLWAAYHPVIASNVYHWTTAPQYAWITPDVGTYSSGIRTFTALAAMQSATSSEGSSVVSATDPLDANHQAVGVDHSTAQPLPADIAALIGQPAGAKRIGAFW